MANYAWQGMATARHRTRHAVWPAYVPALFLGARWFRAASDIGYRRIAYAIVALAAFVSMPVFDRFLH